MFTQNGYPTYYFGHHPDILSLLRHPLRQWRQWRTESAGDGDPAVVKSASLLPLRDMPSSIAALNFRLGYQSSLPPLRNIADRQRGPDIIWAARPGASALKTLFPRARLIMQVVDYYPAFRGQEIRDIEKLDYTSADHVVTIGDALKHYLTTDLGIPASRVSVLGQGVHSTSYDRSLSRPADVPQVSGPIAIWVGVLAKSDPELMRTAATQLAARDGALLMIGPADKAASDIAREFPCVHLLGPRRPSQVPAYLAHADIGLMLYDRNRPDVYRGQNPLKLYEYAAAGLTILSTPHAEYQYIQPPIHICSSAGDVAATVKDYKHSDARAQSARQFARDHDWRLVFDKAQRIIGQLANPNADRYHQRSFSER